jgi:hypothetical protein
VTGPRITFTEFFSSTPGRSRRVVSWATGQPGWVARAAATVFVFAVFLVALLLLIPAMLLGGLVFVALSGWVAARRGLARWRTRRGLSEGRRNVRVIRRDP